MTEANDRFVREREYMAARADAEEAAKEELADWKRKYEEQRDLALSRSDYAERMEARAESAEKERDEAKQRAAINAEKYRIALEERDEARAHEDAPKS